MLLHWKTAQRHLQRAVGRWYSEQSTMASSGIKDFDEMPGPRSLPFIGTLYKYLPFGDYSFSKPFESDMKRYEKYGRIVKEQILPGIYHVHLFDPEDISTLFRKEGNYPKRMTLEGYKAYREARGVSLGLPNLEGEPWKQLRSQVQKNMMRRTSAATYMTAHGPVLPPT